MGTKDEIVQKAKPVAHEETGHRSKPKYEHPDITDNRMVWEVLENEEKPQ